MSWEEKFDYDRIITIKGDNFLQWHLHCVYWRQLHAFSPIHDLHPLISQTCG